MKKLLSIFLLLCIVVSSVSCGSFAYDEEGMLKIIRKKQRIQDDMAIKIADTIELDDALLVFIITGNEYQNHEYYVSEFKQKENKNEYVHTHEMYKRGMDIYALIWQTDYVFIINNEKCKKLQISFLTHERVIEVDQIPFVYYLDLDGEQTFEYNFLDSGGNILR